MVTTQILIIEDDTNTTRQLQSALVQQGHRVDHAVPGLDAIRQMLVHEPDLVILGVDSQHDDWRFCRRLLAFLDRPLFLLLSTRNELDRIKGLELGADDCMVKPVIVAEVLARVRVLLRRSASLPSRSRRSYFTDGDLTVDLTRREVWVNGQPVALTPTEFRLLSCFVKHAGETVPHDRLMMQVWGPNYAGARNAIKLYVHQLRKKLEVDPRQPQRILTRRGEGYLFRLLTDA
jgi:DNA-binding response OmpR family regulator